MSTSEEIEKDVQNIIDTQWNLRKGQKVPTTEDVVLSGGAVELDATFLYADLANSSKMCEEFDRRVTAKIIKAFLATTARAIRSLGGDIVSFDGDRIMGVFIGDSQNTIAAKCALQINYIVNSIIRPKFEEKYEIVKNASFKIDHGVGIDSGTIITVRGGARGANDLIWVGRAPNLAAKLSDIREAPYQSFITDTVYNKLNESSKYSEENKKNMWEERIWTFLDDKIKVFRSNWWWKP